MAGPVKCVWYDRAPKIKRELRRYAHNRDCPVRLPGRCACCDVFVPFDIIEWHEPIIAVQEGPPRDDPRWPTECDRCGYKFLETDAWQVFTDAIYRNSETGQEFFMRELPVGAMYNSHWLPDHHRDRTAWRSRWFCRIALPGSLTGAPTTTEGRFQKPGRGQARSQIFQLPLRS